jgi:hypothetical protein
MDKSSLACAICQGPPDVDRLPRLEQPLLNAQLPPEPASALLPGGR